MNDEITEARKKKRRRYNLKRTSRFVGALALIVVAVIAVNTFTSTTLKDVGDFFSATFSGGGWPSEMGEGAPLQTERLSSAFASVSDNELVVVSRRGAKLQEVDHGFVSPFIAAAGNRIALCNRGSRDIKIFNRTSELVALSTNDAIIDAAMSDNGELALLTESERYMCELTAYGNGEYKSMMSWNGANGFPLLAAISTKGHCMAAVTLSISSGTLSSQITVIDIAGEKELAVTNFDGIVVDLILEDNGSFTAITGEDVFKVSPDGETKSSYSFSGRPLLAVAHDSGSRLALGFGDNRRPAINSAVILDRSLKQCGEVLSCGRINDLCMSGDRLYLLSDGKLLMCAANGGVIKVYKSDIKALNIVEFSSIIEVLPDRAQRLTETIEPPKEDSDVLADA
ncbi:MAG: DUF5711 family protein [Oscillospiraceae bacterium]